ncbi:hypothetical protein E6H32_07980 [Candidatus Bathyarchaeota archaeon]|nr:MAG: hypothetical protein E6H32_07980 [Candidatus Bathyarchaeota archaeon]
MSIRFLLLTPLLLPQPTGKPLTNRQKIALAATIVSVIFLFIAVSLLRHYLGLLGAVILRVKTAIGFENDNP